MMNKIYELMGKWKPKDNMGLWSYIKFKLGFWTEVDTLPEWVYNNNPTYSKGKALKHGQDRVYHQNEVWVGSSLKYMMKWERRKQGELDSDGNYIKKKKLYPL